MSAIARFAASLLSEASQQDDNTPEPSPAGADASASATSQPDTPSGKPGVESRSDVSKMAVLVNFHLAYVALREDAFFISMFVYCTR
jgi:hypothetical protein